MTDKFEYNLSFGYPVLGNCNLCKSNPKCSNELFSLKVGPYYQDSSSKLKLMLIGQDPTIRKNPERVTHVLMLNQGGSIYRWLRDLFGEKLKKIDIYATNTVKCTFSGDLPTERKDLTGYQFLTNFFEQCKVHLKNEIINYEPDFVISFGQPAHMLLTKQLFENSNIPEKMTQAFKGDFHDAFIINDNKKISFKYSPCLHIMTFRVADTYGDMVKTFKSTLLNNL